jgi:hypothetical protein
LQRHWSRMTEREGLEHRKAMRGISNLRERLESEDSRKRESPSIWHWIWHWRGSSLSWPRTRIPRRDVATELPSQRGTSSASTTSATRTHDEPSLVVVRSVAGRCTPAQTGASLDAASRTRNMYLRANSRVSFLASARRFHRNWTRSDFLGSNFNVVSERSV